MEKVEITVNIDQEVVNALNIYLGKKGGSTVQKELEKRLGDLYAEIVPEEVREFIGLRFHATSSKQHSRKTPAKPATASAPAQTQHPSERSEETARGGDVHDGR